MGVTPTENHDDSADQGDPAGSMRSDDASTSQLLAGTVGDQYPNCGAPLASDQRYCIQCGERRGKSRLMPASLSAAPAQMTMGTATDPPGEPPRRRTAPGATVIAGIATLLLALGVGVEIGLIANKGNNSATRAAAPQVITVTGGGGGAAAQTTTAAGRSTATHKHSAAPPKTEAKKAQQAATAPKPTHQAVKKATHAASSVLGGNGGQQNSTVTTGQSCAAGSAGCQNGHFTGTFFGGQ